VDVTDVQPRAATLTTAEELWSMGSGGRRFELVRGRLVERVSPTGWGHGRTVVRLVARLDVHVSRAGLGAVTTETGFVLARDPDLVRGPDVAFVAAGREPARGSNGFVELAPDLAIEVVSPGDTYTEVLAKVDEYLDHGVREVWIVDPQRRRVVVQRPGAPPRTLTADEELTSDLLPGLSLRLADLL
jgi:Uma2 family endonuclease